MLAFIHTVCRFYVSYKKQELYTLREHLGSSAVFGEVRVVHLFSILCRVVYFFLCPVSCIVYSMLPVSIYKNKTMKRMNNSPMCLYIFTCILIFTNASKPINFELCKESLFLYIYHLPVISSPVGFSVQNMACNNCTKINTY